MNRMALALLLLAGAPAFADRAPEPQAQSERSFGEERMERMESKLGLDAAQAARVRATFEKYRGELMPLRKDAFETREELGRELATATPNRSRITELTDRLIRDRGEMRSINERRMGELRSQLSPEQYARLIVRHEGRGRHGRFRHGRR